MKRSRFWVVFSLVMLMITIISLGVSIRYYHLYTTEKQLNMVKNPQIEVKLADERNLKLIFNEAMITRSKVGQKIPDSLISISPALNGFFFWADSKSAVYHLPQSSKQIFSAATRYTIKLSDDLVDIDNRPFTGNKNIVFTGTPFSFDKFTTHYDTANSAVVVELEFNAPCQSAAVEKWLTVTPTRPYRILTNGATKTHKLIIEKVKDGEHLEIGVKAGLPANNMEFKTLKARFARFTVNFNTIKLTGLKTVKDGWNYHLEFKVDHKLDIAALRKNLQVTPQVKFKLTQITPYSYKISGKFKSETYYTVKLLKGLQSLDASVPALTRDELNTVRTPEIRPKIEFIDSKNIFLRANSDLLLPVSSVGVENIEVKIFRIYENNLVWFLGNRGWSGQRYGNELFKSTLTVNNRTDTYSPVVSYLDLGKIIQVAPEGKSVAPTGKLPLRGSTKLNSCPKMTGYRAKPGVYELVLSPQDSWRSIRQLLVITNLGVTCKLADQQAMAMITDLTTGKPVADAEVKLYSDKNQLIVTGKTNKAGQLMLEWTKQLKAVPKVITVKYKADFCVMNLKSAKLQLSTKGFGLHGINYGKQKFSAFIYAPRNIYRPGEIVNIATIVRTLPALKTPKKFPVKFTITRPDGMLFKTKSTLLQQDGFAEVAVPLPVSARTGWYNVKLTIPGNNTSLGRFKFLVDDFEPDTFQVKVNMAKKVSEPQQTITLQVNADYLFGAPVGKGKLTLRSFSRIMPVNNPKFAGFRFSTYSGDAKKSSASTKIGQWQLDASGDAKLKIKIADNPLPLNYRTHYIANVNSSSGNNSSGRCSIPVIKYQRIVGLKALTKVPARSSHVWLIYALLNGKDYQKIKPEEDHELQMTVTHSVYYWGKVIKNSYITDRLIKSSTVVEQRLLPTQYSLGKFSFVPKLEGEYTIKLTNTISGHSSEDRVYCYDNYGDFLYYSSLNRQDDNQASSLGKVTLTYKILPPAGTVPLQLDGVSPSTLKPGGRKSLELIKGNMPNKRLLISLKSPIQGHGFISIENGGEIIEVIPFTATSNSTKLILPLKKSYPWSFKLFATIISNHNNNSSLPGFAYGYKQVDQDISPFKLDIVGEIPQQVKPGATLTLELQVKNGKQAVANAQVTLALVDEGICRLTGFKTPTPLPYFYRPSQLTVTSMSNYGGLIADTLLKSLSHSDILYGGGALFAKALYTKRSEDSQAVTIWKSSLFTDKNGALKVTFKVPQFSGKLRIMAVAFKSTKFGMFEQFITVKNRCVTLAKFPQFLAPNDEVKVPVLLQNSDKIQPYNGKLMINNMLYPISLAPEASHTFFCPLKASSTPRAISVSINNISNDNKIMFNRKLTVKVRSANPPDIKVNSGSFKVNDGNITIKAPGTWSSGQGIFTLSTSPKLGLDGCLRYLVSYPYGCLEQTISGAFSQIYLPKLYSKALPIERGKPLLNNQIQRAINRILTMQLYSGGFVMWPGGKTVWQWGTVYAYDFLTSARDAGYQVPVGLLARTENYIQRRLVRFNGDTATYAMYLLTTRKRHIEQSEVMNMYNRVITNYKLSKLSKASVAYLALAMGNAGFSNYAVRLTAQFKLKVAGDYNNFYRNFYADSNMSSRINDNAVALLALLALAPNDPQVPKLVKILTKYCRDRNYTTHNSASTLRSLAQYLAARQQNPVNCKVIIMRNNRQLGEFKVDNSSEKYLTIQNTNLTDGNITLKVSGTGILYYNYSVVGIPAQPPIAENKIITVKRQILNEDGSVADLNNLKLGELYIVKITLNSTQRANSIVINDMLPACFQIENGQLLTRDNAMKRNFTNSLKPSRTEPRFDRYLIFCSVGNTNQIYDFYYPVRVGYSGTFTLPGIAANSMYDTNIISHQIAENIKVK
jgi:alpha-2-macroglobulin